MQFKNFREVKPLKHKIKITETYVYYIDVDADSKKEALKKAKDYYENEADGCTGVADANTLEDTKFKIVESK